MKTVNDTDILAPLRTDVLAALPTELAPLPADLKAGAGDLTAPRGFNLDTLPIPLLPIEMPTAAWAVGENAAPEENVVLPATSPDLADLAARLLTPSAKNAAPRRGKRTTGEARRALLEDGYRFPYSRVALETIPDGSGMLGTETTFGVRLFWQRGKATLPLVETTALRPIAQVTLNGQRYPVSLGQHGRKKRDRIVLAGRRKTARSPRCALRFVCVVEGREDKLTWHWRIAATSAAIAYDERERAKHPFGENVASAPDEVALYLPFAPGKARIFTQAGVPNVQVLWMNDIAVSVAGINEDANGNGVPILEHTGRGFTLTLRQQEEQAPSLLAGHGVSLTWETWAAPARTEAEARAALLRHAADLADRAQITSLWEAGTLTALVTQNEAALMDANAVDKRGVDRLAFRAVGLDGTPNPKRHAAGEGSDAALAACALLGRFYQTGDDALRRRARLVARDVCDFQIQDTESQHWGAVWDELAGKKHYGDIHGGKTVSVATTARTAKGLLIAHSHFDTEILSRTALAAAQWLLLRLDRDGGYPMERWNTDGPPSDDVARSPWVVGESLAPLVETFRATRNETYLKAALRVVNALREGLSQNRLVPETASTEYLASTIEGVLNVSREYESGELIDLARQMTLGLRARRLPDGSLAEPPGLPTPVSPLAPTLAGARAALALTRVDSDPLWLVFAVRAIRAAGRIAENRTEAGRSLVVADRAALLSLPTAALLCGAQRAKNIETDRDKLTVKRGWQTFTPDPATREYVQVTRADGGPIDYLALVCPVGLQVMVSVIAPADVTEVKISKNNRSPFVRNLLTGEIDVRARLVPLGDGRDAQTGLFLLDT